MNLNEVIAECIEEAKINLAQKTADNYHQAIRRFLAYLESEGIEEDVPMKSINIKHFQGFTIWLAKQEYARGTRRTYLSGLRYFVDWLILSEYLKAPQAQLLKFKKMCENVNRRRESRLPEFVPNEKLKNLLDKAKRRREQKPIKQRDYAMLLLLYSSGCRNEELCNLDVQDIDLEKRRARVVGKGSKEAYIFFTAETSKAIAAYWKARGNREAQAPAFSRHDRGIKKGKLGRLTPNGLRYVVNKVAKAAGLDPKDISPHKFRHAFGIRALKKTGNLAQAQDLLRHANPATTRIYAKITQGELQEAHQSMFEEDE